MLVFVGTVVPNVFIGFSSRSFSSFALSANPSSLSISTSGPFFRNALMPVFVGTVVPNALLPVLVDTVVPNALIPVFVGTVVPNALIPVLVDTCSS